MRARCGRGGSASLAGGRCLTAVAGLVSIFSAASPNSALGDDAGSQSPSYGWRQVWVGADVHSNGWLVYSGATVAPYTDIYSDGLRLRATTGYGGYGWEGRSRIDANDPNSPFPTGQATTDYAEFLAGYYKQMGPMTFKAFAGVAMIEHRLGPVPENTPPDDLPVSGREVGPKGSVELWFNLGPSAFLSLDGGYTTAHGTYASHGRIGYRVNPTISVGLEAVTNGNVKDHDYRGGGFLRYEWIRGEIGVSGGISSSDLGNIEDQSAYGTVNWITNF